MSKDQTPKTPTPPPNLSIEEIAASSLSWLEKNAKALVGAVLVALVVIGGYFAFESYQDSVERKAQEAYYSADAKYIKIKNEFDQADYEAMNPAGKKVEKKDSLKKRKSGDLKQDYGTLPEDYEAIVKAHPGTAAAVQSALLAMEIYQDYKMPEKAVAVGELALASTSKTHLLRSLLDMGLGNAYAEKGDCNKAVEMWKGLLAQENVKSLTGEAALRAGLCYEKLGNVNGAAEMYQKASAATGPASETAKTLLRAVELRKSGGAG